MSSTVFMISPANELTALKRANYDSEHLFQTLLADHPELLGLATTENGRLLLVKREAPVHESEAGGGRWSLDHLFLDQDGVPILVEVKRASDNRTRREVVAQMLDYAANGVAYWQIEEMIAAVRAGAAEGEDPDARLAAFLDDPEASADAFWRKVEANLGSGRIRLVFVADRIPSELRRIVEFLNEQMRSAEVLAIEVEQFLTGDGVRLLTPRLVGVTERAKTAKAVQAPKPALSEAEWLADLAQRKGKPAAAMAAKALQWFRQAGFVVGMTDSQDAMYARLSRPDGKPTWPFFVRRSTGKLETALQYLKDNPAFADEAVRIGLLGEIKALPGLSIATTKSTGWPGIPLDELDKPGVWNGFTAIATDVRARNAGQK